MTGEMKLFNKNASTIICLSKLFLRMDEGEKVPTFEELSNEFSVARGTIQNSLKVLQDEGAIEILPRGRKGTYLIRKDIAKLIRLADIRSFLGAMSLPYSRTYEGLATGLIHTLVNEYQIPVNMSYMRDAAERIDEMLSGRVDFVIVSKLSAGIAIEKGKAIEIVKDFGPRSYLSYHVIVFGNPLKREIEDGMIVGLAKNAFSQNERVRRMCEGKNVTFKEVDYDQMLSKIKHNEIHATVWNRDEINDALIQINMVPIYSDEESTEAVLVVDQRRPELIKLFEELVDVQQVTEIQHQVIEGKMSPKY
ncbi:MAG: GntR family transcriptional regulator [Erysipelotrichaceae bacterium]|nr:GntR family transcriptional regulator [Erysipelotrichaceae bacterium]